MKILHLIDRMSVGGAQSLVVEIAKVQVDMGNKVDVLQLFDSPDTTFTSSLRSMGVAVFSLSKGSMYNPLHIIRIMPYLKKYDIVHVHLFPALYWAGFAKFFSFCKKPMIFTEHSTTNKRRKYKSLILMDRFVYGKCYNAITACSDKVLEMFKMYYPKVDIVSIPNGIDVSKYVSAEPYSKMDLVGITEDSFICTMVARYTYPKRQDTIIDAIAQLPNDFHAILVGSRPSDAEAIKLRSYCIEKGVSDRIHSLYIRNDVPRILKTSDVVIMSSIFEGLSLSSIEGMASGRPFIATNVNGLREVVEGAGELFDLGDSKALRDLLQKFKSNKDYYNEIAERCSERAKEFDIHMVVDKYHKLYNQLIKK